MIIIKYKMSYLDFMPNEVSIQKPQLFDNCDNKTKLGYYIFFFLILGTETVRLIK